MNSYDSQYMLLKENNLKAIINKEKTVVLVAQELQVSRQSIHKWLNRYKRFGIDGLIERKKKGCGVAHNKTSPEIEQLVINTSREYFVDGVQTLHDRLQYEYNLTLHPTTIYRILKRNKVRYTDNQPRTKLRCKKKLYSHKTPGYELQMDTKYPFGYKKGKVIYTIIDDASRWVFVWTYTTANSTNTVDFLQKVLKRAPFLIQKIRTDCGTEFVAHIVLNFLKANHIVYRKNTPYCPEENGKIERFHKTLNTKALVYGFHSNDSIDYIQYRLNLFLHYYNYQKKHRGLGMDGMTPIEKLEEHASVNLTQQCYTP